jgi:hypothetical protein
MELSKKGNSIFLEPTRSDDVSATAYFYLNKPTNILPPLTDTFNRINALKAKCLGNKKKVKNEISTNNIQTLVFNFFIDFVYFL